nr:hypothetical protein [Okeania sp. KiyG1]
MKIKAVTIFYSFFRTVEKISIVPRGMAALGYTLQLPTEDKFLRDEAELRGQIAILLGGRSAEEIVFFKK